jgi:hypothetical protein
MVHGNTIFSRFLPEKFERYSLPLEKKGLSSTLDQKYNFILARYKIKGSEKEWIFVDLHFSAFDKAGETRIQQFRYIETTIFKEYLKGNYVVVGGDWNMRLASTEFPHNTDKKYLFWVEDLPTNIRNELANDGWYFAIDEDVPSVRTDERPYDGNNYTTIIDGFLCSPNVEMVEIKGMDVGLNAAITIQ